MKKLIVCIMAFAFLLTTTAPAMAKGGHGGGKGGGESHSSSHGGGHGGGKGHSGGGHGHGGKGHGGHGKGSGGPSRGHGGHRGGGHYHSSSSTSVYLVGREVIPNVHTFADCKDHSATSETFVSYYSNGTRRSYVTNTIYNNDGAILASGCSDVKHFVYNKKHYFTFYQNKKYQIIDEFGNFISVNNYKQMQEIAPNRLLVKLDKKYGVIDLNNNIITPIKYKEFKQIGPNLFLTKLNGYYGMTDNSNNIFIKNEYDKIKPLYDTYLLKKYDKYGLADKNGKFILKANNKNFNNSG